MAENRDETTRQYYWASEIPTLISSETPSLSSFYRCVTKNQIRKVDNQGQPDVAYNGEDVRHFLRGDLTRRKGETSQRKLPRQRKVSSYEGVMRASNPSTVLQSLMIDVAGYDDLYDLYGLEINQVGLMDAIAPPTYVPWLQTNDHAYWMLFDPKNRKNIIAMLGVLPLREDMINRLINKEVVPSQITAQDVISYDTESKFSIYIVSAVTRSEQKDTIISLIQHLFSYWSEHFISVKSIHASVIDSNEDTPLMRIMTKCFFTPLNHEKDQWELRPLERTYQISFIKNYQECIQEHNEKVKKEKSSMPVLDKPAILSLDDLRAIYTKSLTRKGNEDYTAKVNGIIGVDDNGYVTRRDGYNQRKVWVGRIRNDDDIRATLRINASLFGYSKKFTEDQLVGFRRAWLKKNPDIYRVLEIDGEVIGFIFAMPLPMPVMERILLSEIKVGDVSIEDLQEYKSEQPPVNVYLQTLGLHAKIQGGEKYFAGSYLIAGMERLISDIGRQGVEIGGIFTRSDEPDGLKMIGAMGFDEMSNFSERVGKLVFSLDVSQDKPSLRAYKQALESYKNRHVVEDNI